MYFVIQGDGLIQLQVKGRECGILLLVQHCGLSGSGGRVFDKHPGRCERSKSDGKSLLLAGLD